MKPLSVLVLVSLAAAPARPDDLSALTAWFVTPEETRGDVPALTAAPLKNAAAVQAASDKLWSLYRSGATALGWEKDLPAFPPTLEEIKALPADKRPRLSPATLSEAGKDMPFVLLAKGKRGSHGWPLFLAFHGGGSDPSAKAPHASPMNTQEWQAQMRLFEAVYPDGLYFIPRMADDKDGRWWFSYCQAIYDRAIRRAVLFRDADPDRVYVMGISEGGYAAYRLGAHMADRWAASCSMAGAEPLDTSPPENFRNLPFRCSIGEKDTMFDRIGLARRYFARLGELQKADGSDKAYVNFLDEQKGKGHGVDYKPGPEWISRFERNPLPSKVVWTVQPLHGVVRRQMYWLTLDEVPETKPLHLTASVADNTVTLNAEIQNADKQRVPATGGSLRVYLHDTLANLDQPVKVILNGKTVFEGKTERSLRVLARSLNERGDPKLMFPAEIKVSF